MLTQPGHEAAGVCHPLAVRLRDGGLPGGGGEPENVPSSFVLPTPKITAKLTVGVRYCLDGHVCARWRSQA